MRTSRRLADDHPLRAPPRSVQERGACRDYPNPDVFFNDDAVKPSAVIRQSVREARLVCATCPVREECLDYSLRADEPYGVWGGLDRWDRMHLLGKKPSKFSERLNRPLVTTSLPCDCSTCAGCVPLGLASTLLTSSGDRYCPSCLPASAAVS
ncbi:MAG: WhiB family transcriptional regulator [Actinobacteria bacterium]|nr:WhiB family transcriptional regulator [Actinomycetota bacterium]